MLYGLVGGALAAIVFVASATAVGIYSVLTVFAFVAVVILIAVTRVPVQPKALGVFGSGSDDEEKQDA